jgi:hypothetical protein
MLQKQKIQSTMAYLHVPQPKLLICNGPADTRPTLDLAAFRFKEFALEINTGSKKLDTINGLIFLSCRCCLCARNLKADDPTTRIL